MEGGGEFITNKKKIRKPIKEKVWGCLLCTFNLDVLYLKK